jgi:hypothetical protein
MASKDTIFTGNEFFREASCIAISFRFTRVARELSILKKEKTIAPTCALDQVPHHRLLGGEIGGDRHKYCNLREVSYVFKKKSFIFCDMETETKGLTTKCSDVR